MSVSVEPLAATDWPAVAAIYEQGIAGGDATFETASPTWPAWNAGYLREHRLVARDERGRVIGWAALAPTSTRAAYAGVAEVSVYVDRAARGRGIGRRLLGALLDGADAAGIWTVQAGIFPENRASLLLHTSAGFRVVGTRERIGRMQGRWRDVVLLERRSPVVT